MNQQQRAALADRYRTDGMAGSSPEKLLLAVYDRLRRDLETAAAAVTGQRIEGAHRALVNAQELVYELQIALDPEVWPGANDLRSVYDHLYGLLIEANLTKSPETIERCREIVVPLEESWSAAYQLVHAGADEPAAPSVGAVR